MSLSLCALDGRRVRCFSSPYCVFSTLSWSSYFQLFILDCTENVMWYCQVDELKSVRDTLEKKLSELDGSLKTVQDELEQKGLDMSVKVGAINPVNLITAVVLFKYETFSCFLKQRFMVELDHSVQLVTVPTS